MVLGLHRAVLITLAMAVFVELPLAGMCLWLCRRVEVERSRREAALAAALRRAFAGGRVWFPGPRRRAAARPRSASARPASSRAISERRRWPPAVARAFAR